MAQKKNDGLNAKTRYERDHPGVSIRLTKEEKAKLDAVIAKEGVTSSKIIKRYLNGYVKEKEARKKALDDAYEEGMVKGYSNGKDDFLIEVPCSVCKKPDNMIIVLKGGKIHKRMIRKEIFTHPECDQRAKAHNSRRLK